MSHLTWHAYYFDALGSAPPSARVAILADNEDDATKTAIAQMGGYMRVHVTRPVWEIPNPPVGPVANAARKDADAGR